MKEIILIKNGELALKGLNRRTFEDILVKNMRRRLESAGKFKFTIAQSTVVAEPEDGADLDEAVERLGIPQMMLTDGPHGLRKQESDSDALGLGRSVPATCFPTAFWRGTPVSSTGKSLLRKGTMRLRIVSAQTLSNIFRMQLTTV